MGQQAIELMAVRAQQRVAFGRPIAQHGAFLERLGQARIDLDAARLVVLDAAHTLDCVGNKLVNAFAYKRASMLVNIRHA